MVLLSFISKLEIYLLPVLGRYLTMIKTSAKSALVAGSCLFIYLTLLAIKIPTAISNSNSDLSSDNGRTDSIASSKDNHSNTTEALPINPPKQSKPQLSLESRLELAESPNTDPEILAELIGDLSLAVRLAAKNNPNISAESIKSIDSQSKIAFDWNSNPQQLQNLSDSLWDWIRLTVAQNPSTTESALLSLAKDPIREIQLAVANNPQTPANILSVLVNSKQLGVRTAIAQHPQATETILHSLFDTQKNTIDNRANLPASIIERFYQERSTEKPLWDDIALHHFLLRQPNTPTWILKELADIDLKFLKTYKLKKFSRKPSPETLAKWIEDDLEFLADVAVHPQVSAEILASLVKYPNQEVKLAVALNPKTSKRIRLEIFDDIFAGYESWMKVKIAEDANTPVSVLETLASDSSSGSVSLEWLKQGLGNDAPLVKKVSRFYDRYQYSQKILSSLREDFSLRRKILADWNNLYSSLNSEEQKQITELGSAMLPAIGLNGGIPAQDSWLAGYLTNNDEKIRPEFILYGMLLLDTISFDSNKEEIKIAAALLANSQSPKSLRDKLKQKYLSNFKFGSYSSDKENVKLRLALGYNPVIPETERIAYLEEALALDRNDIRKAIAENPQTPEIILEQVASGNFSYRIKLIIENPHTPSHLLRKAVSELKKEEKSQDYLLEKIARNPNAPKDLLAELLDDGFSNDVLRNPSLNTLDKYQFELQIKQKEERQQALDLLSQRIDRPYAMELVIESGNFDAKRTIALNRETPVRILEKLAQDSDDTVRLAVSNNSKLPLYIAWQLTQDSNYKVRQALARRRSEIEILEILAKDEHGAVRNQVAENDNASFKILELLANDESEYVRADVVAHPNTSVEILTKLGNDPSHKVAKALIRNEKTPVEILEKIGLERGLVNIRNPKTSPQALAAAVERLIKVKFDPDENLYNLLENVPGSQMPANVLSELANHKKEIIRLQVARHQNTPNSALETMVHDTYEPVLWGIARNPNSSSQLLLKLLDIYGEEVAGAISERKAIPPEVRVRLKDFQ